MDTNTPSIAVFCDYENLAIGSKEGKFEKFDLSIALERILDRGKIVFKKAYSDWTRYKDDRRQLHEHAFELVEIPHVSYSGKNSADIRLVVDALDLCYTKPHVGTFAILSGDSDFSPLVSKLRENNKEVIGLGVRHSSSNLLIENCDEFIYYDDLVKKRKTKAKKSASGKKSGEKKSTSKELTKSQEEALDLVLKTIEVMIEQREGLLWGPTIRQAIKRKRPSFSETEYEFRNFNAILEEGQKLGILKLRKDKDTGHYAVLSITAN